MAVKRYADIFPRHRKQTLTVMAGFLAVASVLLGALLFFAGLDVLLIAPIVVFTAVVVGLGMVAVLNHALEPLDYVTRVMTHSSNQPSSVELPNLNGTRHEKTGYKQVLDELYSLVVAKHDVASELDQEPLDLLDRSSCGVIALDSKRNIVYHNSAAPVVTHNDTPSVQLNFEGSSTLESWLSSAEHSKVKASQVWSRVQSVPPGEAERKLYDVVATYEKGGVNGVDTVIVTVERTADYAHDEENMDFIALAAHELRGPVTVIHGYIDILRRELPLDTRQTALFDRLEVSANRLSSYIANILNVSKYDRRHLKLRLHEERMSTIYQLIADDMNLRASTQNRLLSVTIPDDLPTVAADRSSLGEVLANFIDNAIKYSNEGGTVEVSAQQEGNFVKVAVTDHGVGMPASTVNNLFSKFYRSHRSRYNVAGTGLGLYLSKAIVESHGGTVSVTSKEGKGSTFSCMIPVFSAVKDKLLAQGGTNSDIIKTDSGWIKNHASFRG